MPSYRLHPLNPADRIERSDEFLAPHDEEAKVPVLRAAGDAAG